MAGYVAGLGVLALAKQYDLAESTVMKHIKRAGVYQSERQWKKSSVQPRRQRRLKSQEFSNETKRQRFAEESGVCQECQRPIGQGTNWRLATYHHIITCKDGGSAEPSNCMVLHFECHNDPVIFRKLHGFDIERLDNYLRVAQSGRAHPSDG